MSVQTWIEGLVRTAVDEAITDAKLDIITEIQATEHRLIMQITSLPGLLGSQIANVALDAGAVAAKVIAGLADELSSLPQQIIQGVLQGMNPFKGPR
jgi:hypothetical protein